MHDPFPHAQRGEDLVPRDKTFARRHRTTIVGIAIFLLSFAVYQINLDHPPRVIGDEDTYVKIARNMTNGFWLESSAQGLRPQNHVHPPGGKLLISAGLWLHGRPANEYVNSADPAEDNGRYIHGKSGDACGYYNLQCSDDARAWRFSSTLFGAGGVAAAYLLAIRLFHRFEAGIAAALLLHLDGMYYLHSRLAMLDIFAISCTLIALASAFTPTWWARILAGAAFGTALASKVNSVFLLPALLFILLVHGPGPVRGSTPWIRSLPRVATTFATGILIPIGVYLLSYIPILQALQTSGGWSYAWRQWYGIQKDAILFHQNVYFDHFHSSQPIEWIPMIRPMRYWTLFFDEKVANIYAIGNPVIWWTATAALITIPVIMVLRNRTRLHTHLMHLTKNAFTGRVSFQGDAGLLMAASLFWLAYLPWFLIERTMFLYYMTFITPFFAIFAGGLLAKAWERGGGWRVLAVTYTAIAVVAFLLLLPLVTGEPIDPAKHDAMNSAVPWIHSP